MKNTLKDLERTPKELEGILHGMESLSQNFYVGAIRLDHHAFVEFNGFLRKYIELCHHALRDGHDFTQANTHTGRSVFKLQEQDAEYIGEKFGCIFETCFSGNWKLVESFLQSAFGFDRKAIRAAIDKADELERTQGAAVSAESIAAGLPELQHWEPTHQQGENCPCIKCMNRRLLIVSGGWDGR